MAVTQAQIDYMEQCIADGVRQVTLPGGQSTTYQTTASMEAALARMKTEFAAQQRAEAGVRKNRRTLLYYGGRGYD